MKRCCLSLLLAGLTLVSLACRVDAATPVSAQAATTTGSAGTTAPSVGGDVSAAQDSTAVVLSPKAPGPIHVEAKPGTEASLSISVANASASQTRSVSLAVSTGSDSAERASWVRLSDQQMSLEPSQTREVTITFTVPREAVPGSTSYAVFASEFPGGPPISNSLTPELVVSGTQHAVLSITDVRLTDSSGGEAFQITIRNSGTAQGTGTVTLSPVGLGTISSPLGAIQAGTVDAVLVPFTGAVAGTKYVTEIVVDYGNGDTAGWRGRVTAGDHTNRGESASDPYTPSTVPSAPPTSVSADGSVTSLGSQAEPPKQPTTSSTNWAGPAVLALGVLIALGFVLGSRRRDRRPVIMSTMAAPALPGSDHLRDAIVTLANQVAHLADEMGRQRAGSSTRLEGALSTVNSSFDDDYSAVIVDEDFVDEDSADADFDDADFEFEFDEAAADVEADVDAQLDAEVSAAEEPELEPITIEVESEPVLEFVPLEIDPELVEPDQFDDSELDVAPVIALDEPLEPLMEIEPFDEDADSDPEVTDGIEYREVDRIAPQVAVTEQADAELLEEEEAVEVEAVEVEDTEEDDTEEDDTDEQIDDEYDAVAAATLMIERLRQANAPASVNPYAEMWPESTISRDNEVHANIDDDDIDDDIDGAEDVIAPAEDDGDDRATERDSITVKNLMKLVSDLGSDAALDYFRRST